MDNGVGKNNATGKNGWMDYGLPPTNQKEEGKQVNYRTLNYLATIRNGDEFYSSSRKRWVKTTLPGFVVPFGIKYRRPIKKKKGSK